MLKLPKGIPCRRRDARSRSRDQGDQPGAGRRGSDPAVPRRSGDAGARQHPNIATVYELFREDDELLLVMELVGGQTFEQLITGSGRLPVERATALTDRSSAS